MQRPQTKACTGRNVDREKLCDKIETLKNVIRSLRKNLAETKDDRRLKKEEISCLKMKLQKTDEVIHAQTLEISTLKKLNRKLTEISINNADKLDEMCTWWLQKYRKYSEAEVDKEAEKTRFYIGQKIASLKRTQSEKCESIQDQHSGYYIDDQGEDQGENNPSENAHSSLEDIRDHGLLGDVQGVGPLEAFESNGPLEDFQGNVPLENVQGNDP
ncbi:uncharacterized protein LOC117173161 [Belonocnema kinseyi]|uniref:uncharacterized protein LOC117173161 n=1 Tax=Belonocnema kinseyi TaxID=2817044 RepID=UPI00143D731B|nr:uncharacterized protein LOC117173161 [Belonocnema kinseyi]